MVYKSSTTSSGGGSGTVTQINTSNGLTGGPITGSGTVQTILTTKGDLLGYAATGARVPVGADGTGLFANSNDANGVTYQPPYATPGYTSGRWYSSIIGTVSTKLSAANATTAYITPFYVGKRTTFTDIGAWVVSAATATKFRMGIYTGTPIIGQVMTLVAGSDGEVGTISAAAMNTITFGSAITLDKGWYGLLFFANGSMTANTCGTNALAFVTGVTDLNTAYPEIGATGQTYGSLPSITLALVTDPAQAYAVGLKAQ